MIICLACVCVEETCCLAIACYSSYHALLSKSNGNIFSKPPYPTLLVFINLNLSICLLGPLVKQMSGKEAAIAVAWTAVSRSQPFGIVLPPPTWASGGSSQGAPWEASGHSTPPALLPWPAQGFKFKGTERPAVAGWGQQGHADVAKLHQDDSQPSPVCGWWKTMNPFQDWSHLTAARDLKPCLHCISVWGQSQLLAQDVLVLCHSHAGV